MGADRVSLKLDARAKIKGPVLKITLVYLLLTSLIPSLLSMYYDGPFNNYYDAVTQLMTSGAMWSDSDILQLMQQYLTGTSVTIAVFCGILIGLVVTVIKYGYLFYTMKVSRQQQDNGIGDLFYGFGMVGKIILLSIYTTVLVALWTMLFIIPGIIAAYRYMMAPYILLDDPSISVTEAVRRSKVMMNGHKWELFVLQFSFIGWALLNGVIGSAGSAIGNMMGIQAVSVILEFALSCIVGVWLTGYMQVAEINFYDSITGRRRYYNSQQYNRDPEYSDYQPQYDWNNQNDQNQDPWN